MDPHSALKGTLEIRRYEYFKEESKRELIAPFQALAKFIASAGAVALILEVRYFSEHSMQIYISRLSAILIAFVLLNISYTKFGKKYPVALIHTLLLTIICSFGIMIFLIPKTLVFNSYIISLIFFVAALFLSWDVTNQIFVAIYYNVVFAVSILLNDKKIYFLPNMLESVVLVLIISIMAIVASYINYRLRQEAIVKNFEVGYSEKKFRNLFENSAEGIFQFSNDGKFLIANPALIKLLGYSTEEEMKKLVLETDVFKRKTDWELLSKLLEKQGKVRNYRVPFKRKDGTEITVRMNVRISEDDSGTNVFEGSLQDITQQVQAENEKQKALEALRSEKVKADTAAKKAQQESSFKTKFLASMSHEVRTPMNSVMGFLTLIEHDLFENKEELKGFSRDARLAAESLLDIINNILDISKIEAGKMELDEFEFDIRDEVQKAISIIAQTARSKGINLENFIDNEIPSKVYGDQTRYRQIVLNLLSNALKFTDQGKISIRVTVRAKTDSYIELLTSVEDTGTGIPNDKLSILFEPYTQVRTKKSSKDGTGLGLVICKEFVRLMHGDIHVESKVGVGSKFSFSVRMKLYPGAVISDAEIEAQSEAQAASGSAAPAAEKPAVEVPQNILLKKRLLLVEDNPISQNLESKILREIGYEVVAVSSGQEAIDSVVAGSFDIVLMDVEMTEMDGITATKKIRELESKNAKVPIIAVTAHSSMKDRERCLAAGMDDYIAKPINIHFLKITIDRWLKSEA